MPAYPVPNLEELEELRNILLGQVGVEYNQEDLEKLGAVAAAIYWIKHRDEIPNLCAQK